VSFRISIQIEQGCTEVSKHGKFLQCHFFILLPVAVYSFFEALLAATELAAIVSPHPTNFRPIRLFATSPVACLNSLVLLATGMSISRSPHLLHLERSLLTNTASTTEPEPADIRLVAPPGVEVGVHLHEERRCSRLRRYVRERSAQEGGYGDCE